MLEHGVLIIVIVIIANRQTEHEEALVKEMKDKFEKQLRLMKTELKQLQTAKREHARALQKNVRTTTQLCVYSCNRLFY